MKDELAVLRFDCLKAGLSMDSPVLVWIYQSSYIPIRKPQGGTSILGGRGAWPQNLPLKLLLESQILPPKI